MGWDTKITTHPLKKQAKDLNRHFTKEVMEWQIGIWKYVENVERGGKRTQ